MQKYYSNGKLLLTAEYVVLDGAKALAVPVKYGQELRIEKNSGNKLLWKSFLKDGSLWFSCIFSLPDLSFADETNLNTALTLQKILRTTRKLNPDFLTGDYEFHVSTFLNFPKNWGLGTSSTLINNIAEWAKINPYTLLYKSFGGSGYDIACARNNHPVLFKINGDNPLVETAAFDPVFKDRLYFIYLNKKQNSSHEIGKYKELTKNVAPHIKIIDKITKKMITCNDLTEFEKLLSEHEKIIASLIQRKPVQKFFFPDYFGRIKSLGAWGGDFILATGNDKTPEYFKNKGFHTVIRYQDMIL